ncbi:MAG: GGDEF domain-containing protein [Planctomycetaceae bacterium]
MQSESLLQPFTSGSWLKFCELHRSRALRGSLALATVVALIDYATGDEFPLIVCYLPCVIVVCWVSHFLVGVSLAIACCTGWLVDDFLQIEEQTLTAAECWTAATHLAYFLIIISMLLRLRAAQQREETYARTDSLTGLMNRRAFREAAEREILRATRTGSPLAVAYLDCDNFKTVNDTRGHHEGDLLLKAIAETLQQSVRAMDTPARMGGDEFAILLPAADRQDAEHVVQRVRGALSETMDANEWPVTFSIGVVVHESIPESVDELIQHSDMLMYKVKHDRKDAVAYELCV